MTKPTKMFFLLLLSANLIAQTPVWYDPFTPKDEVEANFTDKGDKLARVLKQVIGDEYIAVEGKGTDIKNWRKIFKKPKRN